MKHALLLVLLLVLLVACSSKKPAAQARPELLETVTVLADRVCACETDKECIRAIREEWDAQKVDLMNHGLTGDQKSPSMRRSCGCDRVAMPEA
jgi:uncharacterized protein YcfL